MINDIIVTKLNNGEIIHKDDPLMIIFEKMPKILNFETKRIFFYQKLGELGRNR